MGFTPLQDIVISAPFGNWLNFEGATSTLGTFTLNYRGGFWYRLWRCLRTLRYNRRSQAWINKLGLPNPGIASLDKSKDYINKVISIHGFNFSEWDELAKRASELSPLAVELNLSCPNVGHKHNIGDVLSAIEHLLSTNIMVIAKIPPVRWMDLVNPLYDVGVTTFHACNTIPTPGGGLSGKPLKHYSLWAVEEIKQKFGEKAYIIGGGGVSSIDDVNDYKKAGADAVAIGSMLLNPFNIKKVKAIIKHGNV